MPFQWKNHWMSMSMSTAKNLCISLHCYIDHHDQHKLRHDNRKQWCGVGLPLHSPHEYQLHGYISCTPRHTPSTSVSSSLPWFQLALHRLDLLGRLYNLLYGQAALGFTEHALESELSCVEGPACMVLPLKPVVHQLLSLSFGLRSSSSSSLWTWST